MMVAMATDIRVILIKLADRLHNMRTISALRKQKQIEKAKETLEIYAPIAHRLGIHAIKWELEDLAFASLHPRKYQEIKGLVNQQRDQRERLRRRRRHDAPRELDALGIARPDLRPRQALLFDLLEDDPQGPRVQRDLRPHGDARDRRLGEGLLRRGRRHPLAVEAAARALQGLRRDAEVQHVPVAAHDGDRARGAAARDPDPHARDARASPSTASPRTGSTRPTRAGAASRCRRARRSSAGCARCSTGSRSSRDPKEFVAHLKVDLFDEEVFVFTPKGEVKSLAAGATPLDFAYEIHTELGHRCVGAKVNGRIVPLNYQLKLGRPRRGADQQARPRPVTRLARRRQDDARAQQDPQFFKAEGREDAEHAGRELLQEHLRKAGLPAQKIAGSPLLADVIREMGFRKADDFYIALGGAKISPKVVVNKVMQRLKQGEAAEEESGVAETLVSDAPPRRQPTGSSSAYGIRVEGVDDVHAAARQVLPPGARRPDRRLRLARPRDHDPPRRLPERRRAAQGPRALRARPLGGRPRDRRSRSSSRSTPGIATGLLEDLSRTFSEARHQHRRGALHRQPPDGREPLRRRGRRHARRSRRRSAACATSTASSTPTASRRAPERALATPARLAYAGRGS